MCYLLFEFQDQVKGRASSQFTDLTEFVCQVEMRECADLPVFPSQRLSAVSESLIAAAPRDRQACAKTMASKSQRLTATDSLPPKHSSGPLCFLLASFLPLLSICFFPLHICQGKLRRVRHKERDVVNWHLSSCFVLVRAQRTFVKF